MFMRPAISKEDADRLIDMIPTIRSDAYFNDCSQDLVRHYESALQNYDCADLLKLTMSIYAKKQETEQNHRKFGQIDKQFMKQAEDLLFGELALAIGVPKDEVPAYIASRVEGSERKSA